MAGAPLGNQNAKNAKIWQQAIKRAIARRANGTLDKGLDRLAERFLDAIENGDIQSFKELGDRLEGKPSQAIGLSGGEDATPVAINIVTK